MKLNDAGKTEEALANCRRAIRLCPGLAEARNIEGNILKKLGRFGEAAEIAKSPNRFVSVSLDGAANDPDGDPPFEIEAGDAQRPDVQAMSREQARAFVDAVGQLPPEQREAFLLQAEGGLSLEEIATVTNAGHETVKSRLRYAMAKLRTAMEAWQ